MRSHFSLKSIMSAVGEKATVILYTHINRHPGTPNKTELQQTKTLYNIPLPKPAKNNVCSKTMSYGTEIQDS